MSTYPREVLEEIRGRIDIVDLVGAYVPLRRAGNAFKALCPFHDEKTPSFQVNPARQIFKCFGCSEGGDLFGFVMKIERIGFSEAVELLADRAHVTLSKDGDPQEGNRRRDLYEVNSWAATFFREAYASRAGDACRAYVAARALDPAVVKEFGLGYAPGGEAIVHHGRRSGLDPALLERAGLVRPSNRGGGARDLFWDPRLVFPILDAQGRAVGFGGRTLDGSEPKYVNSPETEVFHKGRTLFAMDRLRGHKRDRPLFVAEGYTDVMMAVQSGVTGIVATLGTALTPEHARLLHRYADRIVLLYDGDRAGLMAAERGAQVLLKAGHVHLQVAVLPEGEDPCDFFQRLGPDGVVELEGRTIDLVEFLLQRTLERHEATSVAGRHAAAQSLLEVAVAMDDPVARDLFLGRVAERIRVGKDTLLERLERPRRPQRAVPQPAGDRHLPPADRRAIRQVIEAVVNRPSLLGHSSLPRPGALPDPTLLAAWRGGARQTAALLASVQDDELHRLAESALLSEEAVADSDLQRLLEGAAAWLDNRSRLAAVRALKEQVAIGGDRDALRLIQDHVRSVKGRDRSAPGGSAIDPGTEAAEPTE